MVEQHVDRQSYLLSGPLVDGIKYPRSLSEH